ncbi:uncharacterized protein [Porites lutea]|uniref:uncharacterized protein n=1 Tax=Porites lutea TaxID=51062 RepID=UPI003CC65B5E
MQGRIFCSFLIGKSRLAPLKVTTIPRLELTAATVSVRLNKILTKELQIPIDKVTFWTDSMTVLRYIANESKRFHTYVVNRVAFIREESSPSQRRYIDSKSNPADEASRGVTADVFVQNGRWLKGPVFLLTTESEWADHVQERAELTENDPEIKKEPKSFAVSVSEVYASVVRIVKRFSSWMNLLKFIAMCLRCQRRFRLRKREPGPNGHRNVGPLSLEPMSCQDLDFAERELIMFDQRNAFHEEIETIKKGGCVKKSSCLAKLSPVLIGGVLRFGGQLSRAPLPDESRHQIIISKDSPLGVLLIRFFHEKSGHSGREYVLALLRERFWLIRANTTARSVLSSCFQCKRRHGPAGEQKMADLPCSRVTPDQPPFTCVGIDYFGPFLVRQKRSLVKRYGAIFTCLALRAVHLEISHTLDTDSFILALRRFIARRGQVKEIRSDNGTNFTGAEKELCVMISSWNQATIHDTLLQKGIKWVFNPPAASHHGGVWERLIRSTRKILEALTKEQVLDDECLQTLLCEAESIINGRPLTKVSDDPNDLEPLTPNHLLLLRQNESLPPGLFEKNTYSRRRWRQVQYLANVFWGRWKREYLPLLQERQKWFRPRRNFTRLETRLSLMNRRPGTCGRLVESHKCSQIEMVSCVA